MPHPYKPHKLTPDQQYAMEVARVGFMSACPFFAHYFYSECREYPTLDISTAATDGRTLYYNPEYLAGLKPAERVFVFAHEISHAIQRHPTRMKHYLRNDLPISGKPADMNTANEAADYVINADLVEQGVGMINKNWLWRPDIVGSDVWEDVYPRVYKDPPKGQGKGAGQGGAQGAQGGPGNPGATPTAGQTYGGSGRAPKGAKGDPVAAAAGGAFDQVLEPWTDPATGEVDLPDEGAFKEALARAAAAAKAVGKMPGNWQRMVDEVLEPQVNWRDHVRMLMTGKIGSRGEDWSRPNRRRLALNPIVVMPGKKGYGAECVVVAVDTSGSIGQRELDAFCAEVGGVLNDVKPRRIVVISCDARVNQVEEVTSMDELGALRAKGFGGGGGTDFKPVFDYVDEHELKPETLIYLTDLYGGFPSEAPAYPTIWAATTDVEPPWGDVVRVKV